MQLLNYLFTKQNTYFNIFADFFYNREVESKKRKSSAKATLSTTNAPSAEDFYTGGGKRSNQGNIEARNFLADAFLGRNSSVAPATQYVQPAPPLPPPQDYYSHAAHYPPRSHGRDYVGREYDGWDDCRRSRSRSRHKRRHYYSSSDSPSPEPRKRKGNKRHHSPSPSGGTKELIDIA